MEKDPLQSKRSINLITPETTYLGFPAYIFSININRKYLRLNLRSILITHIGSDALVNKTINVVYRARPAYNDPGAGEYEWDFLIATYTGTAADVIFNQLDFDKVDLWAGDSIIVYWNNAYNALGKVVTNFSQI